MEIIASKYSWKSKQGKKAFIPKPKIVFMILEAKSPYLPSFVLLSIHSEYSFTKIRGFTFKSDRRVTAHSLE